MGVKYTVFTKDDFVSEEIVLHSVRNHLPTKAAAVDYGVCEHATSFVGNPISSFSRLLVTDRLSSNPVSQNWNYDGDRFCLEAWQCNFYCVHSCINACM